MASEEFQRPVRLGNPGISELALYRLRALIPERGRQGRRGGVTRLPRLFFFLCVKGIQVEEPLLFRIPCHLEGFDGDKLKRLLGHPLNCFCSDLPTARLFPSCGTKGRVGQMQVLECSGRNTNLRNTTGILIIYIFYFMLNYILVTRILAAAT